MAASRLSEAQKDDIVVRYRGGASSAELAALFGCSANTVSRVVKAALPPEVYAQLKQLRGKGSSRATAVDSQPAVVSQPAVAPQAAVAQQTALVEQPNPAEQPADEAQVPAPVPAAPGDDDDADGPGVLAIDDADDFGDDEADSDADDDGDSDADDEAETAVVHEPVQCRCLSEAQLPASGYLLVDRQVELQPTPLGDCPDLGALPPEEAERKALQVFLNPRQAKRHCGRSQRVIQLPEMAMLQRTAPYLLAQGISRVVIEGSLYSLPGS
jgi:hypothetical protein